MHEAGLQDHQGAELVLTKEFIETYPILQTIMGDLGYNKKHLRQYIQEELELTLEIVKKEPSGQWVAPNAEPEKQKGFEVHKWRWIVERTFGWIGRYRRMSKEYDLLTCSSKTWVFIAMSRLMLARLTL